MTRSTNRRVAHRSSRRLAAGLVAGAAALLVAGCSAGQVAETARKNPSVPGVNLTEQIREDGMLVGSVALRDIAIPYVEGGYEEGGSAPLTGLIFNDTRETVTVRIVPAEPDDGEVQMVQARSVVVTGGAASPSPTGSPDASPTASPDASPTASPDASPTASPDASPTGAAGEPASFTIPADGYVAMTADDSRVLLSGLTEPLTPGMSVPVVFRFSNGPELRANVPVVPPLTAPARATPGSGEGEGGH